MEFTELVTRTRSYRRFKQDPISEEALLELVDLARLSASGGNQQPLKYLVSSDPEMNEKIFPTTVWAAALKEWDGPAEGERPTAYIVLLHDTEVSKGTGGDAGISGWSICLGAAERGIGACMIGSIRRPELVEVLGIPERYQIALIIALGVAGETVVLEGPREDGSMTYYRSDDDVHHTPKRPLEDVLVRL
ncbi:MAG: nitroreductase family protein [Planctomycetota bacterium]|jgi:nitroreductase